MRNAQDDDFAYLYLSSASSLVKNWDARRGAIFFLQCFLSKIAFLELHFVWDTLYGNLYGGHRK
jgi:hypothetical protein